MTITHPAGFRAAGVPAGLKSTGAKDVALVVNDLEPVRSGNCAVVVASEVGHIAAEFGVFEDEVRLAVVAHGISAGAMRCRTTEPAARAP